jgi:hypothetical protein
MKRLKVALVGLAAVMTIGATFAFTGHKNVRFAATQYLFTGAAGQEHDPSMYTATSGQSAVAGNARLVWLSVDNSEIYTSGTFINKPKVDVPSGSQIQALVTSALTTPKADKSISSPFAEHVEIGN